MEKQLKDIRVLFTPEPLLSCQKLYYCEFSPQAPPDIVFRWNWTGTHFDPIVPRWNCHVVNALCQNTSKTFTEAIFNRIYGYGSRARGRWAVAKNNSTNGAKDARLVDLEREDKTPGWFYQEPLLDLNKEPLEVWETRWVIMGYRPVLGFAKRKRVSARNIAGEVLEYQFLAPVSDDRVRRFCIHAGFEYGELDMMHYQDRDYIIDINPTPGDAAYQKMPPHQAKKFIDLYNKALLEWLTSLL